MLLWTCDIQEPKLDEITRLEAMRSGRPEKHGSGRAELARGNARPANTKAWRSLKETIQKKRAQSSFGHVRKLHRSGHLNSDSILLGRSMTLRRQCLNDQTPALGCLQPACPPVKNKSSPSSPICRDRKISPFPCVWECWEAQKPEMQMSTEVHLAPNTRTAKFVVRESYRIDA